MVQRRTNFSGEHTYNYEEIRNQSNIIRLHDPDGGRMTKRAVEKTVQRNLNDETAREKGVFSQCHTLSK